MRTSYRMSHEDENPKKQQPTIEENVEKESEKLVEEVFQENKQRREDEMLRTYHEIVSAKYDSSGKDQANKAVDVVKQEAKEEAQEKLQKAKKSRKKVWIVILCIIGALVIGLGGVAVYNNFFRHDNSLEAITDRIDNLYTSVNKEDIKNGITISDLDQYYLDLNEASDNGEDISSASTELDTIGYFLSDKATLLEYDSEDYDLTTAGLHDSINGIKENTEAYSVPGLAVTINDLCTKVNGDYETFIVLRSEMQGITDATTFDEEGYKSRIANIKHKPNQEELNAIYDNIVADKKAAEAEQALKDAVTQEAQEQAQKALEEAQKLQQETQQKLEADEQELQDRANSAKEGASDVLNGIRDAVTGGDSSEETTEESGTESNTE